MPAEDQREHGGDEHEHHHLRRPDMPGHGEEALSASNVQRPDDAERDPDAACEEADVRSRMPKSKFSAFRISSTKTAVRSGSAFANA